MAAGAQAKHWVRAGAGLRGWTGKASDVTAASTVRAGKGLFFAGGTCIRGWTAVGSGGSRVGSKAGDGVGTAVGWGSGQIGMGGGWKVLFFSSESRKPN